MTFRPFGGYGAVIEIGCFFSATLGRAQWCVLRFGSRNLSSPFFQVHTVIKLTRLDGEAFVLNADLIRYVERRPDTFVSLIGGERLMVKETMDEVVDRAVAYQQQKHFMPTPQTVRRVTA